MADSLPRALAVVVGLGLVLATLSALQVLGGPGQQRSESARAVVQIVVLATAWLTVNGPFEGRVLWVVWPRHGLTQADVLVVPPLLLAALLAVARTRG